MLKNLKEKMDMMTKEMRTTIRKTKAFKRKR